jgi:hypothetical protein
VLILALIRQVDAERDLACRTEPQEPMHRKITALCRVRGIGNNFAAVLAREVLVAAIKDRYRASGRAEKSRILSTSQRCFARALGLKFPRNFSRGGIMMRIWNATIPCMIANSLMLPFALNSIMPVSVLARQLYVADASSEADSQVQSYVDQIDPLVGQEQLAEAVTLFLKAIDLLPAASESSQRLTSELPQRLRARAKELREGGSRDKAVYYDVFADVTAGYVKPATDLKVADRPLVARAPDLPNPDPSTRGGKPNAAKEADTSPVATTKPQIAKVSPPAQLNGQQTKPEGEMRVPAPREADPSSTTTAASPGPSRPDLLIPERRQQETRLKDTAREQPYPLQSSTLPHPSPEVTDPSSPNLPTLSLTAQRLLLERGDAMLSQKNVVAARMLFVRAANAGVGVAALKLAETYDSAFIALHNLIGIKADLHEAETWYRKAATLGEKEAERRLKILEERRKTLAVQ